MNLQMNLINQQQQKTMHKAAKVAGITLLFNLLVPTLSYVFIQSKLFKGENLRTVAENVIKGETIFRLGILSELILSIGLIVLGYSLYLMVRHVNKSVSKMALILKVVEATIMAIVALISFFALQLVLNSNAFMPIADDNIKTIGGFIFKQHSILNSIPMIFLGVEMVLFTVLLCKSALIPRWLSRFGMLSFLLIFVYAILTLTTSWTDFMLLTLPSFLFELVCGVWLLTKGIIIPNKA